MLTGLFFSVLRRSVFGAAAAVLVWVACLLLRRLHTPRALCCALWSAVLVCLLIPAGIPVTLPGRTAQSAAALQAAAEAQAAGRGVISAAGAQAAGAQAVGAQAAGAPAGAQAAGAPGARAQLLAGFWLAGTAALALYALAADFRLRRSVALAYKAGDAVPYYTGSCVATPFAAGLLHPRIYLPAGLSAAEQRCILLHEQAHLHRRDNWLRPVFYAAVCIHWFNPFAWLAYRQMVLDMEASCDEAVLRALGDGMKPDYCRSLLRFAVRQPAAPLAFGESCIKARIRSILDYRRPHFWGMAGGLCLAVAVAVACLARPVSAESAAIPQSASSSAPAAADSAPAGGGAESAAGEAAAENIPDADGISAADAASSAAQSATGSVPVPASGDTAFPGGESAAESGAADAAAIHTAHEIAFLWPVPSSTVCSRPMVAGGHRGTDIAAEENAAIVAAADGTVVYADYDVSYGWAVLLDHGGGLCTLYAHCSGLNVAAGDRVVQGQQIAAVGSTGSSTGNHLHFEVLSSASWRGKAAPAALDADTVRYNPADWFPFAG
jgi:murein DD-endopeptidase MepM/ murein hydrolase activator NlpD